MKEAVKTFVNGFVMWLVYTGGMVAALYTSELVGRGRKDEAVMGVTTIMATNFYGWFGGVGWALGLLAVTSLMCCFLRTDTALHRLWWGLVLLLLMGVLPNTEPKNWREVELTERMLSNSNLRTNVVSCPARNGTSRTLYWTSQTWGSHTELVGEGWYVEWLSGEDAASNKQVYREIRYRSPHDGSACTFNPPIYALCFSEGKVPSAQKCGFDKPQSGVTIRNIRYSLSIEQSDLPWVWLADWTRDIYSSQEDWKKRTYEWNVMSIKQTHEYADDLHTQRTFQWITVAAVWTVFTFIPMWWFFYSLPFREEAEEEEMTSFPGRWGSVARVFVGAFVPWVLFTVALTVCLYAVELLGRNTQIETNLRDNYYTLMMNLYGWLGGLACGVVVCVFTELLWPLLPNPVDYGQWEIMYLKVWWVVVLTVSVGVSVNTSPGTSWRTIELGEKGLAAGNTTTIGCWKNPTPDSLALPEGSTHAFLEDAEWEVGWSDHHNPPHFLVHRKWGWEFRLHEIQYAGPVPGCAFSPSIYALCIGKNMTREACGFTDKGRVTIRQAHVSEYFEEDGMFSLPWAALIPQRWYENIRPMELEFEEIKGRIFEWNSDGKEVTRSRIEGLKAKSREQRTAVFFAWIGTTFLPLVVCFLIIPCRDPDLKDDDDPLGYNSYPIELEEIGQTDHI